MPPKTRRQVAAAAAAAAAAHDRPPAPEPARPAKRARRGKQSAQGPTPEWTPHAIDENTEQVENASVEPAAEPAPEDETPAGLDKSSWWRFWPEFADIDLHQQRVPGGFGDGGEAAPLAGQVVDGRDNQEEEDDDDEALNAPAPARPGLERSTNDLLLFEVPIHVDTRLPLPVDLVGVSNFLATRSEMVAEVALRRVPMLKAHRQRIDYEKNWFVCGYGPVIEEVRYYLLNVDGWSKEQLAAVTQADFDSQLAHDPYWEKVKTLRRNEEIIHERVDKDGYAKPITPPKFEVTHVWALVLAKDAFYRHDGDWPEDPEATNNDQWSYAQGRILPLRGGVDAYYGDWYDGRAETFYRLGLVAKKSKWYKPPIGTNRWPAQQDISAPWYELCVYARLDAINAALRRDEYVPLLAHFLGDKCAWQFELLYRQSLPLPPLYVPDTLDAPVPTDGVIPPGFRLDLRSDQQRTVAWLVHLERSNPTLHAHWATRDTNEEQVRQFERTVLRHVPPILQLGPHGMYFNVFTRKFARDHHDWDDLHLPMRSMPVRGALDVSAMGAGKTATALALVHANPFRSVRDMPFSRDCLVSRATLVVVGAALVGQWVDEAKRVLPEGAKIVSLTTIRDHKNLTWDDVLLADVVVVTRAFLQNANYQRRVANIAGQRAYCLPRMCYAYDRDEFGWASASRAAYGWRACPNADEAGLFNHMLNEHICTLRAQGRQTFGPTKHGIVLERVAWHRVVLDEVHEFAHVQRVAASTGGNHATNASNTRVAESLVFALQARFWVGLTGTPPLNSNAAVTALAACVGVRGLAQTGDAAQAFLNEFVRRNEPELHVPRVHYLTEWVDLHPVELALLAAVPRGTDVRSRVMMCNHHQITDTMVRLVGPTVESVEEVAARVQRGREVEMDGLVARGRELQEEIAAVVAKLRTAVERDPDVAEKLAAVGVTVAQAGVLLVGSTDVMDRLAAAVALPGEPETPVVLPGVGDAVPTGAELEKLALDLIAACDDLTGLRSSLTLIAAQYRFMATVLETLVRNDTPVECPVCLDSIKPAAPVVITHCGHVFCELCTAQIKTRGCSICRSPLTGADATLRIARGDAQEPKVDKYGTKLAALTRYIQRVTNADPTAKLLLFCQFKRLSTLLRHALVDLGIVAVSMAGGTVTTKYNALEKFRTKADVKVLLMSADESVSGLRVTEASHVVLVHPFVGVAESVARAMEMQGVARVVRAGQTREVTVARFVARGTVEEDVTRWRARAW
ncbi:hypothetical protein AMAG_15850 [Allomyces macrogynus ATCC 38327]|uniref:RING-type domain-containing protein n=1 Tax=Allomyces macrogynus (strain ATCC 38327) TaxID=578462 RepID=A0A0L0T9G4_ALLM3|nr:hypothetical protein AMAG_15850 [Allomyces macrogynus ATCC 38327]|eukprot:KNE71189.1 hypothetical protein AMAG_15850 [Allomyces macrogynus ATCC 38327]